MRRQSGFTLIELVLASSLSVFMMFIVVTAYQANQQSYQYQVAISTMNGNARYIAQTMIARLTAADVDVSGGASLSLIDFDGDDTGNAATDSVLVTWDDTTDTDQAQLCDTASTADPATAVFSLSVGASGTSSLHCTSTDPAAPLPPGAPGQELVPEVEHMRILYGENTNDGDGLTSIDEWVGWDDITDPNNVLAIQVGFMLRSENPITRDYTDQVYNLLDIALTKNDGRLRQVYSFTVALTPRIPAHEQP